MSGDLNSIGRRGIIYSNKKGGQREEKDIQKCRISIKIEGGWREEQS
jgi:hypothetical protein